METWIAAGLLGFCLGVIATAALAPRRSAVHVHHYERVSLYRGMSANRTALAVAAESLLARMLEREEHERAALARTPEAGERPPGAGGE